MQNPRDVMFLAARSPSPPLQSMRLATRLRSWLVWWLVATLCVYSASASVLRVMGPQHWHATVDLAPRVSSASSLSDAWIGPLGRLVASVHALADAAHERAHALGAAPHHHSHRAVQRHWHDRGDDSVRLPAGEAIDPELADLKAAAAIGGATLLPMPASHGAWQLPTHANGRWPMAGVHAWRNALTAPPVEPPIV